MNTTCKGDHKGHLCVLVSEGLFDKIKTLAQHPKYICFNCGRVAKSQNNLCNPIKMEE